MKLSSSVLALVLAASVPLQSGEPAVSSTTPADPGVPALSHRAAEPPSAPLMVGDVAPDFTWQADSRRHVSMRQVLEHGAVLLVFAPDDAHLASLQRERDGLLDLGVVPVAVVPHRSGTAESRARKLGLAYTVVPDNRRIVAGQYGAVDEMRQSMVPSWFVVDRRGQVRALGRGGIPEQNLARLAATVLAIPSGEVPVPARTR